MAYDLLAVTDIVQECGVGGFGLGQGQSVWKGYQYIVKNNVLRRMSLNSSEGTVGDG